MTRILDKIRSRRKEHLKLRASQSINGTDGDGGALATPPSFYYSLEFFPPKTEPGLENLLT
jgi:hypothetical protein